MIIIKKTYLLVIALISLSTICKPKRHKIMAAYKLAYYCVCLSIIEPIFQHHCSTRN